MAAKKTRPERKRPAKTKRGTDSRNAEPAPAPASSLIGQLEQELKTTRAGLQSTIDELESSNEELRASDEEIRSMNEELHCLNEQMNTVNGQLRDKVDDLETVNNDIANLLNCTNIPTVFLDTGFRIKRFTPATTRLFSLVTGDVGRPLDDISTKFVDDELLTDAEEVFRGLAPREAEVRGDGGRWYIRRIAPYRTLDDRIDGVVITFVDITDRKLAADTAVSQLAAIVESSADAIYNKGLDGTVRTWNRAAERLFGYTAREITGQSVSLIVPQDRRAELAEYLSRLALGESIRQLETERVRKDGQRVSVSMTISPIRDSEGRVVSASVIAHDITDRKQAEEALRDREERLRAILSTAADAIITIDQQGIIQSVNPAAQHMFGYTPGEMVGQNVALLMPSPYQQEHDGYLRHYLETGHARMIGTGRELVARRKDGSSFPIDLSVSQVDHLKVFTGIVRDITRRKELEREVVEIASLQQRRIGEDLHDRVGQELTALNLLAGTLAKSVRTRPDQAAQIVERMSHGLHRAQQELRNALNGLVHSSIESGRFTEELRKLANRIRREGVLACTFDSQEDVTITDDLAATHLYLIAQEAAHNSVKHAQARNIRIALEKIDGGLVLTVTDDGVGMPQGPMETQGLGLRLMKNRAAVIGAKLEIASAEAKGTMVTCTWLETNDVQEKNRPETGSRPDH